VKIEKLEYRGRLGCGGLSTIIVPVSLQERNYRKALGYEDLSQNILRAFGNGGRNVARQTRNSRVASGGCTISSQAEEHAAG
jgi:hypothetical protein